MEPTNADYTSAIDELLAAAYQMMGGEMMLRSYAHRQGWAGVKTESAARYLVARGRTFADVLDELEPRCCLVAFCPRPAEGRVTVGGRKVRACTAHADTLGFDLYRGGGK